jgi:hypothetical protein
MPLDTPARKPEVENSAIENVASVTARTLSQTPGAFYDELASDLKNRPADVLTRVAGGVGIGVVGTVLLKSPKVAAAVSVIGLGYTGIEAATSLSGFVAKAADANTESERSQLANLSSKNLGRSLTNFTEAAPGMMIGGYAASKAFGAPPLYGRIGQAAEEKILMPIKDRAAFIGPGTERLPAALINGEKQADLLEISRILGGKHPWKGVETGRTLDLNTLKLSRQVTGNENTISWLPASTKADKIPFHIHGPNAGVGARPSLDDIMATRNLGIVKQGDQVAFYVGHLDELSMMQKAGKAELLQPGMRTVVVDHANQTASRLTGRYDRTQGWLFNEPKTLDYQSTLKALKAVDLRNPWSTLEGIGAK